LRLLEKPESGCVSLLNDVHLVFKLPFEVACRQNVILVVLLDVLKNLLMIDEIWILPLQVTFHKEKVVCL
jgi:hypothetical protein